MNQELNRLYYYLHRVDTNKKTRLRMMYESGYAREPREFNANLRQLQRQGLIIKNDDGKLEVIR